MVNKFKLTIAVLAAIAITLPCAAFAEGEAAALGQAVELTGGALPQQLRDITGVGSGASSWDYLSQKIAYGYFVEVYSNFDAIAKSRVDRRNGIEDLVGSSYQTDNKANLAIADVKFNQDYSQRVMTTEFAQRSSRGTQIANTYTMNTYLPHSDGSVEFFKDGLLARVDNQRSVDQLGNISFKNIYNFVYDQDRRLMLSHEYDTTDHLGNKTHGTFNCTYTNDSVFYGTDSTNANKNYLSYSVTETDHTGRAITMTWNAGTYEGKYLRDFTQTTVDAMPGKDTGTTTLHRFNIQYSAPGRMSSYEEEGVANHIEGEAGTDVAFTYKLNRTNIQYNARGDVASYEDTRWEQNPDTTTWSSDLSTWTKITSQVTLEYLDVPSQFGPDVDLDQARIAKQTVTSKVENVDGSYRDETAVTEYTYDKTYTLTGATGTSTFTGRAASYVATDTGATMEGSLYSGTTENTYDIVYGTPVVASSHSTVKYFGAEDANVTTAAETTTTYTYGLVNNMIKILSSSETSVTTLPTLDAAGAYPTTRTITTTYTYNENGYLDSVVGNGTETGREFSDEKGFVNPYTSEITVTYEVKLDSPLEKSVDETITYDDVTS
jgi:hypothetical protein